MIDWVIGMKVIVLGCGMIGSVIARDFSGSVDCEITVADRDLRRAERTASAIGGAAWTRIDTTDKPDLVEKLGAFDLVLGALPGDFGYVALEAAVEAGVDMVDVSFTPENPLELDGEAQRAGITVIPDCGVAPGLSNMLVGHACSRLERVRDIHIMVGGIPETPVPPLGYTVTWSAEGLIDEYVRPASIVEGGRVVEVPALSGLEEIDFPGVGRLEAFYTDGLRTLVGSFPGVENMWEKTLRYPGHIESIRLLRTLGFFDDEPVRVGDSPVSPRLVTARLLERTLRMPDVGDLLAMVIEVRGEAEGYRFHILDRHDREAGVSAMARTTGYTASIVAGMLARGEVEGKGVLPAERLGMDRGVAEGVLARLRERGVVVTETPL
jgi:lysine 6-dehydrogenase